MPDSTLSFEFFPPKTDAGRDKLVTAREELAELNPGFFSVTYGAGGSTRDFTQQTVLGIHEAGYAVAPHLSFGGDSRERVLELLQRYATAGIDRVVALRGDLPSGMGGARLVHAAELVALIREKFGDRFRIAVACYPEIHPEAPGYDADIAFLKAKFDAGADLGLTQYFYSADAFAYFRDRCHAAGITRPIHPGIMPITNRTSLLRFSDNCGADVPRWIRQRLADFGDDDAGLREFGIDVVTHLCQRLVAEGVEGFHFYTMNQAEPTRTLCRNLGLGG